jgi:uncharacterized RDD family membrane protein YckC
VVRFQPISDAAGAGVTIDPAGAVLAGLVSLVLGAIYFIGAWARGAATPGQRLLGLRVEAAGDHGALSLSQATARWLLLLGPLSLGSLAATVLPGLRPWVGPFLFFWFAILLVTTLRSPLRQGLHDRLAGSVVTRIGRESRRSD